MQLMSLVGWVVYIASAVAGMVYLLTNFDSDNYGAVFAFATALVIGWHVVAAVFRSESAKLDDEYFQRRRQRDKRMEESDPEAHQAMLEQRYLETTYGPIKPEVICPHCSTKGHVRVKAGLAKDRTRETGVGAVIGPKKVTERTVQNAHCGNCTMTWQV